jgi:hypothetical protein
MDHAQRDVSEYNIPTSVKVKRVKQGRSDETTNLTSPTDSTAITDNVSIRAFQNRAFDSPEEKKSFERAQKFAIQKYVKMVFFKHVSLMNLWMAVLNV